jgi:hypothetical protein
MDTKQRKEFNNRVFIKILDFVEHFYPRIYENSRRRYAELEEDKFELMKGKKNADEDYNAWFLTKLILPNGVSVVQMADSFPEKYFTDDEKKMIKNLMNYKESIFNILTISKDGQTYEIMDFADNKIYKIKTFNFPNKFKKGDTISAFIVKDLENNYFFLGGVTSYNMTNKLEFIQIFLLKLELEEKLRKERERLKIDWEIEKDSPKSADDFWENKTKINGVWIDDETGEELG